MRAAVGLVVIGVGISACSGDEAGGFSRATGGASGSAGGGQGGSPSSDGGGTGGTAGSSGPCRNSLDCTNGRVCDRPSQRCVECSTSADCASGRICAVFECRLPCVSDRECVAQGLLCDKVAGHCAPPPGTGGAPNTGTGGAPSDGGATNTGGAPSDGGATGTGGVANTGGVVITGGAPSTGGVVTTGGAPSTGGVVTTGGAPSTGGVVNTGGAVATGGVPATGGTSGCSDSDGDGLTDCVETADADTWTDPAIFNGMRVRRANQCSNAGNCTENDTIAEVNTCMASVDETRDQYSGWDWENPPDNICDAGYAFKPNWTLCDSSWAAEWQGCIRLAGPGPHCFQIAGSASEGCASLFFNGATAADVQSGGVTKCFVIAEGNYSIRWHYTMDNGTASSMHVRYCGGTGATCTPTQAIPSRMLRVACP